MTLPLSLLPLLTSHLEPLVLLDIHDAVLLVTEALGRIVAAESLHDKDGIPTDETLKYFCAKHKLFLCNVTWKYVWAC